VAGLLGIPLPRFRLKVVDDSGRAVAQGEVGELVVRGPGVMRGYHGRREAELADGWLRTGDLARRRPLGLVEFVGRKKDVIKHGGYSVFAAEVEEVLEQHPAVAEAAVVGLPDAVKGQLPAAVVRRVGPAGFEWSGEAELRAWAAERLAEYKVPVRVIFIDDLPRTGTDKVDKRLLLNSFGQAPGS
jgi:acyl-CoA synthetase (AMP-forming)/AMP-acid ligase II